MPYVADVVSAMYMRGIHAGVRSRFAEPNLLTWYQIYGNADACLRDDRMSMAKFVWGRLRHWRPGIVSLNPLSFSLSPFTLSPPDLLPRA